MRIRCGWSPTLIRAISRPVRNEITATRSLPATETKQYLPSSLAADQYGTLPTLTRRCSANGLRVTIAA